MKKLLFVALLLASAFTMAQGVPIGRDIYGGVIKGHMDAEATGSFHVKKVGNRWEWYTPLGNPYFMLAVDNIRLGGDLGTDENGNSNGWYAEQKYAIGTGPADGFVDPKVRWGYYSRQRLMDWGFTAVGMYSYNPVIPDLTKTPLSWPTMAAMKPNKMPYIVTLNMSRTARIAGAKDIWASFPELYGQFADPYDPAFDASCESEAKRVQAMSDPYILATFSGQSDDLTGTDSSHANVGFLVAAANYAWASDPNGPAGEVTYTDTKFYAKAALLDFLKAKYTTIEALNAAWGTSYTQWDPTAEGWGVGTGFMDENGTNLPNWSKNQTAYPPGNISFPAMKNDLSEFAGQLVKKYYDVVAGKLHQFTTYPVISQNFATPASYVFNAVAGNVDLLSIEVGTGTGGGVVNSTADQMYAASGKPAIAKIPYYIANEDSPLALHGTVSAIEDYTTDCTNGKKITCATCNFKWYTTYIKPWSNEALLKFSSLSWISAWRPELEYWVYFKNFLSPTEFSLCLYNNTTSDANYLNANLKVGDTFYRVDIMNPQVSAAGTLLTQTARANTYKAAVYSSFTRQAVNGDFYVIGLDWWAWSDNGWSNSKYAEINNFGVVTLRDNAYDGVQNRIATSTDAYGFTRGGEEGNYGDFLTIVKEANKGAIQQMLTGSYSQGISFKGVAVH